MLQVAAGEKRADFAEFGNGIAVIGEWAREQRTEGLESFVKEIEASLPGGGPVLPAVVQGYVAMKTLVDATRAAKSLDREPVLRKLGEITYDTPYGPLKYKASDGGGKWQLLTDETLLVVQYREKSGQEVVWPEAKANGKLVYPVKP
jgi:branched-chain amino acid transport system substrate-binding protein